MAGVNKAILIGHLGRDPEVRAFPNGGRLCNLRIATSESWRDKATGERRERTEWHTVVISNDKMLEVAERYLRKGSKVYVEGQIKTRKHTGSDGIERYYTEIVVGAFTGALVLLDKMDTGSRGTPDDYDRDAAASTSTSTSTQGVDDEIPY